MTDDRRQGTRDARQSAEGISVIGPSLPAFCLPVPVVVLAVLPFLLAAGCKNRALELARQEARDAKVAAKRMDVSLEAAAKEIATLKEELSSVRQNRDNLQKQVDQLMHERDQASTFAQQAQEAISNLTTRETGQKSVTASLEKQIAELKTLVEDQQKLIEQLKGTAASPATTTAQAADKPSAPDPNQKP